MIAKQQIDCVLIQNGCAHEIWRGQRKADLPAMHASLWAAIVEVESGAVAEGDSWTGAIFVKLDRDPKPGARRELERSDATMARAAEDIWGVLKTKGLVSDDDLPAAARERLVRRAALRDILKD